MMVRGAFARNFAAVSVAHGAIVVALLVTSLFSSCVRSRQPIIIPAEFRVEVPVPPAEQEGPVQPEEPAPAPKENEPAAELKDESAPAVKPTPEKPKIEVSKVRVKRPPQTAPQVKPAEPPKLSPDEVAKLIALGATPGARASLSPEDLRRIIANNVPLRPQGALLTGDVLYLEIVRKTMHDAWMQPSSVAVAGLVTKVDIALELNGAVTGRKLSKSSGNEVMDQSVMNAVNTVSRIEGLPPSFIESHRTITVAFELTDRQTAERR